LFGVCRDSQVDEAVGFLTKNLDQRFDGGVLYLYDRDADSLLGESGEGVPDSLRDASSKIGIGGSSFREFSKPTLLSS
jgi:hypothetical protein